MAEKKEAKDKQLAEYQNKLDNLKEVIAFVDSLIADASLSQTDKWLAFLENKRVYTFFYTLTCGPFEQYKSLKSKVAVAIQMMKFDKRREKGDKYDQITESNILSDNKISNIINLDEVPIFELAKKESFAMPRINDSNIFLLKPIEPFGDCQDFNKIQERTLQFIHSLEISIQCFHDTDPKDSAEWIRSAYPHDTYDEKIKRMMEYAPRPLDIESDYDSIEKFKKQIEYYKNDFLDEMVATIEASNMNLYRETENVKTVVKEAIPFFENDEYSIQFFMDAKLNDQDSDSESGSDSDLTSKDETRSKSYSNDSQSESTGMKMLSFSSRNYSLLQDLKRDLNIYMFKKNKNTHSIQTFSFVDSISLSDIKDSFSEKEKDDWKEQAQQFGCTKSSLFLISEFDGFEDQ